MPSLKRERKRETFVVTGRYPFPIDMLRYDQCWPEHESEAYLIAASLRDDPPRGVMNITMRTHGRGPTVGRWESFGWKVLADVRAG